MLAVIGLVMPSAYVVETPGPAIDVAGKYEGKQLVTRSVQMRIGDTPTSAKGKNSPVDNLLNLRGTAHCRANEQSRTNCPKNGQAGLGYMS